MVDLTKRFVEPTQLVMFDADPLPHAHCPVRAGWEGQHRHVACAVCGLLLCATSKTAREVLQTRGAAEVLIDLGPNEVSSHRVAGPGSQTRIVRITTARCGHKTVTAVEATAWQ